MNLRPHRREEPEVTITPLIDVVFLLLIFFMVSTTFRKESEFDIQLPEASPEPTNTSQQLEISIDVSGRYAVNNQPLLNAELTTLKSALAQAAGSERQQPVMIRADAQTAHQAVVKAMDAAGQLGFSRLGIVTVHATATDSASNNP